MRNLASIQQITNLQPIEGADRIEYASVLGWKVVVVKKDDFKVGDLCVYFEVDSMLPENNPAFDFLKNSKGTIKRLRTMKMRGVLSQGMIMPLGILSECSSDVDYLEGLDVTELLKVKKYEPPEPEAKFGFRAGHGIPFPEFIFKTDETRIQAIPDIVEELKGHPYVITVKEDGTSVTFFVKDGEFGVCSRNRRVKREPDYPSIYWDMAEKYGIEERMQGCEHNQALQAEITGPGIQKNRMGREEKCISLFNLFDIDDCKYFGYEALHQTALIFDLPVVQELERGDNFNYTMDELINLAATATYPNGTPAEGIVIRPMTEMKSEILKGDRLSFKVVNNLYLLKYNL